MNVLAQHWDVRAIDESGVLRATNKTGFMFEADGLDGTFLGAEDSAAFHQDWRSAIRLQPGEELQILFRKRVEFAGWIEEQLSRSFLGENTYGRRILLDRLADQVKRMSQDSPKLLSQKILICFWSAEPLHTQALNEKRLAVRAQLNAFGIGARILNRESVQREINVSARDLKTVAGETPEWPALHLTPGAVEIGGDVFRALELTKLPENSTWFGMIQGLTRLPYPLDICLRLKAKDSRPLIARLERKRNLLSAQRAGKSTSAPAVDTQLEQIHGVLRSLAEKSESIFAMQLIVGLRLPRELGTIQRHALGTLVRAGSQLDFCDLEECTLTTFDAYLECIPGFRGKTLRAHTVLGSNAIHFLPFFRPSPGDKGPVMTFQTREASLYGIDPVDARLANYNWLVSGTSGAGKSFFVNSLLTQSTSMDPDMFIVDIGGSYNKLTRFMGGRVLSLEPGRGFSVSPFFLERSDDDTEEKMRRRHIFHIFLEMVRVDGRLPAVSIRQLLSELLDEIFEMPGLPAHPVSHILGRLREIGTPEAKRLLLLLQPWSRENFLGQFLDNDRPLKLDNRMVTVDLKGLTEFEDLSRVVQLIVCAAIWGRVRQAGGKRFSWIVLDEVAFSLLKSQPHFVDELVSTLRKQFAGAVIVVQDLEKITSNPAGAGILQNTQSKAILQQRGDPRNFAEALSLSDLDLYAIQSLRRKRGSFSDIFLIRDTERTVIRHAPSPLEYWLSTTAPEDTRELPANAADADFRAMIVDFARRKPKGAS